MTVKEMNDALKDMKKVYNFKNDKTHIALGFGNRCFQECNVHLETIDEEHDVHISMSKCASNEDGR